jgi:hypothetical protein
MGHWCPAKNYVFLHNFSENLDDQSFWKRPAERTSLELTALDSDLDSDIEGSE